jgi:hypothetical protein
MYLDGSGKQLIGNVGQVNGKATTNTAGGQNIIVEFESEAVSPDGQKTARIESGDIWLIEGSQKNRIATIGSDLRGILWYDHTHLIYSMRTSGNTKMVLINLKGEEARVLYEGDDDIVFSSDRQYFAHRHFQSYYEDECSYCSDETKQRRADEKHQAESNNGIWVYRINDSQHRKITEYSYDIYRGVAWITDSHRVVFTMKNYSDKTSIDEGLYMINVDDEGDKGKRISTTTRGINFSKVVWSPNQDAFVTDDGTLITFGGRPERKLVNNYSVKYIWLPTGKILITSTSSDDPGTWMTDPASENMQKLTEHPLDLQYELSPNEQIILTTGGGYLWTLSVEGDNLKQLTTESGYSNPQWL